MVKIKEGFKGERLVSLPEELLTSYRGEPLINNLYVRKIGFFPRVKYHFLQKEHGCDYAMLIYCTEGKGWYRILGKQYTVEKYQYIIIPPGIPYSFGADEEDPWTIYWLHFQGKLRDQFLPSHPVPVTILPNEYSRLQDRLRLFEEIYDLLLYVPLQFSGLFHLSGAIPPYHDSLAKRISVYGTGHTLYA